MRYLIIIALAAFLAAPAYAAFEGPGANTPSSAQSGFQGPTGGAMADTVAKALTLSDDAPVVLTGNIVMQIAGSKDDYIFKDATGEIKVDIDRKVFKDRRVTPENTVRISGKIDKDFGKDAEVDVKMLEIIN